MTLSVCVCVYVGVSMGPLYVLSALSVGSSWCSPCAVFPTIPHRRTRIVRAVRSLVKPPCPLCRRVAAYRPRQRNPPGEEVKRGQYMRSVVALRHTHYTPPLPLLRRTTTTATTATTAVWAPLPPLYYTCLKPRPVHLEAIQIQPDGRLDRLPPLLPRALPRRDATRRRLARQARAWRGGGGGGSGGG